MPPRNIFKILNQNGILPRILTRSYAGGYKVMKRPDFNNLKMPLDANASSVMDILKGKIELHGAITVADYMNLVLTNPADGYYMKKDVIGDSGDFITSPEISQLFGEILGVWFYFESRKLGPCAPLQIVELGPGKGTLITDILRAVTRLGLKSSDISIHLVEVSSVMQNVQASRLCLTHKGSDEDKPYNYEGETVGGSKVYWYNDISKIPNGFSWYIAHEFFDVLPIHKFQKTEQGWREILIGLNENKELEYRLSTKDTSPQQLYLRPPLTDRNIDHLEICPRGLAIAKQLAQRVDRDGGLALIADYGHEGEKGDTFRAFHKHQLADPLKSPGLHDLTADVDFQQLRLAASETSADENYALVLGPVSQMDFLKRSESEARLQVLIDNAEEKNKENINAAYDMLTNPQKMGKRFKFMAFYPSSMASIIEKYKALGFTL